MNKDDANRRMHFCKEMQNHYNATAEFNNEATFCLNETKQIKLSLLVGSQSTIHA